MGPVSNFVIKLVKVRMELQVFDDLFQGLTLGYKITDELLFSVYLHFMRWTSIASIVHQITRPFAYNTRCYGQRIWFQSRWTAISPSNAIPVWCAAQHIPWPSTSLWCGKSTHIPCRWANECHRERDLWSNPGRYLTNIFLQVLKFWTHLKIFTFYRNQVWFGGSSQSQWKPFR